MHLSDTFRISTNLHAIVRQPSLPRILRAILQLPRTTDATVCRSVLAKLSNAVSMCVSRTSVREREIRQKQGGGGGRRDGESEEIKGEGPPQM